jgi:hypothetical protein
MVLASAANTYTGGTDNLQGTMRVPASGSIPANSNINNNGTFELHKAATVGTVGGTGTLQVGDGAVGIAAEAVHVRQAALSVNAASTLKIAASSLAVGVSKVDSVTIASDARLNLNDNKLITLNPAGTATGGVYNGIQGEVQRANNFGGWDQPGLTTDQADALGGLTTIGVATGEQVRGLGPTDTDTFAGQTITGASTIAMYTYAGDANLDGTIDGGDYGIIDNFVQVPGADGYGNGDFNYDGAIDGGDYGIIDNNVQAQGAPFFTSGSVVAESAGLSGVTAVPEPASLSVIALGAMSILGRRRRK